LPVSLRFAPGRGSSLSARSRLPSTKRRLVRYTVEPPTATVRAIVDFLAELLAENGRLIYSPEWRLYAPVSESNRALLPGIAASAHLARASTSAGLFRMDTSQRVPGSDGVHVYIAVQDASDSVRFLKLCTIGAGLPASAGT
jgi:hypothetical protein